MHTSPGSASHSISGHDISRLKGRGSVWRVRGGRGERAPSKLPCCLPPVNKSASVRLCCEQWRWLGATSPHVRCSFPPLHGTFVSFCVHTAPPPPFSATLLHVSAAGWRTRPGPHPGWRALPDLPADPSPPPPIGVVLNPATTPSIERGQQAGTAVSIFCTPAGTRYSMNRGRGLLAHLPAAQLEPRHPIFIIYTSTRLRMDVTHALRRGALHTPAACKKLVGQSRACGCCALQQLPRHTQPRCQHLGRMRVMGLHCMGLLFTPAPCA